MSDLADHYDLVVIGAGPAGLGAAAAACARGVETLLLDENVAVGGQIYRGLATASAARRRTLGSDYEKGDELIRKFAESTASYLPRASVWMASKGLEIGISCAGVSRTIRCSHIVLASGAMERPFPIPGWTLPGVMTIGGVQGLLKTSGLVPTGTFVLAGSGPLLWQAASQLLRGGVKPAAMLDTGSTVRVLEAASAVPEFLTSPYFLKAIKLWQQVRRSVPVVSGVTMLAAEGGDRLAKVLYRRGNRETESIDVGGLFLHQGVVPGTNMANAIGCLLAWNDHQACWQPVIDVWGRSSIPSISIAGDAAGIMGALCSGHHGALCGLDAALQLGRIDETQRDTQAEPIRRRFRWHYRGRRFLDRAFLADLSFRVPALEAVVCRCEEVTGRQIANVLDSLAGIGPNQLKTFLRCGMGKCQGRSCNLTVTEMIAAHRDVSPSEVGHFRSRFPIKPISVAELAALPHAPEDVRAVVRE